jgi:hypothetical protein
MLESFIERSKTAKEHGPANAGLPHAWFPLSTRFEMVTETRTCQWRKSVTDFVSDNAKM